MKSSLSHRGDDTGEPRRHFLGDGVERLVSNLPHSRARVDRRNFDSAFAGVADDHIAGQHDANVVLEAQRLVREARIAGAQMR